MSKKTDFYDRLGISQNASQEDIRKAYRSAAQRLHPDVNIKAGATEMFLNIKEAYDVLSDPSKKSTYDGQKAKDTPPPPPVRINTYYSSTTLSSSVDKQLHYVLLEMEVLAKPKDAYETGAPLNVGLILDHSTSMMGPRLEVVKASAIEILRQLRPKDIISITAFNDRAEIIIPAGSYVGDHKREAMVRAPAASGGTEIFQGLETAYNEVRKNLLPSYVNHIILITDGHTYGDENRCLELAQQAAEQGIGISCLGIGSEWNDVFLDKIAEITGGSCFYIKNPADIGMFLKQKFAGLGQAYAERINLDFKVGASIELRYAFRLKPEAGVLNITPPIRLGSIPRGSRQRVLLEFLVSSIPTDVQNIVLIDGDITFDIPQQENTTYRIPITVARSVEKNIQPEPPPRAIVEAMSKLTLYRMQEKAKNE
jgi:Ca-activated chloride channel family protein